MGAHFYKRAVYRHLMGVHLIGMHLVGVHLTGVHFIGVYSKNIPVVSEEGATSAVVWLPS